MGASPSKRTTRSDTKNRPAAGDTGPAFQERLEAELAEAERRAWEALGRYKFVLFGYWCGVWVHLARLETKPRPNPWRGIVKTARAHLATVEGAGGTRDGTR